MREYLSVTYGQSANANLYRQAKLDSFEEDLGLKGSDYSTAVAIVNIGFVNISTKFNPC